MWADRACADLALRYLDTWHANTSETRPFFIAAGFQSPRLPWSYPASVAATRYPAGAAALSVASHGSSPDRSAAEDLEWFRPVEIDQYTDVNVTHSVPMSKQQQQAVRLAYYAGITDVDDQLGRLLDALKTKQVDGDTVIVLTADHAQNLGEGNMWSMMNLLETSLRVPLLIRPALNDVRYSAAGGPRKIYKHPVELLDLFPTIVALAALPPPPAAWALQGTDLSKAMVSGAKAKPLDAAFGQITRCLNCTLSYWGDKQALPNGEILGCRKDAEDRAFLVPCAHTPRAQFDYMGMSVRTQDWRYSSFCEWDGVSLSANWSACAKPELYNHTADTALYDVDNNGEPLNLAGQSGTKKVQRQLHALLRQRFDESSLHQEERQRLLKLKHDDQAQAEAPLFVSGPFGDRMILQSNHYYGQRAFLSGTAEPDATLTIIAPMREDKGSDIVTVVDEQGYWKVTLEPQQAHMTNTYNITIKGTTPKGKLYAPRTAHDVRYGDVIICSGQSNMVCTTAILLCPALPVSAYILMLCLCVCIGSARRVRC